MYGGHVMYTWYWVKNNEKMYNNIKDCIQENDIEQREINNKILSSCGHTLEIAKKKRIKQEKNLIKKECSDCMGTGKIVIDDNFIKCNNCNGKGYK